MYTCTFTEKPKPNNRRKAAIRLDQFPVRAPIHRAVENRNKRQQKKSTDTGSLELTKKP
jgi:hypothetical protein